MSHFGSEELSRATSLLPDDVLKGLGTTGRRVLLSAILAMTLADGNLADEELSYLQELAQYLHVTEELDLSPDGVDTVKLLATLRGLRLIPELSYAVLRCVAATASSDGSVADSERSLFLEMAVALGVREDQATRILEAGHKPPVT